MQFVLAALVSGRTRDYKWNNFVGTVVITVLIDVVRQRVRPWRARTYELQQYYLSDVSG